MEKERSTLECIISTAMEGAIPLVRWRDLHPLEIGKSLLAGY
jgi:hypothetical protein